MLRALFHHRRCDLAVDLGCAPELRWFQERQREVRIGVRSHAAGVGARVALECALVVLDRGHVDRDLTGCERHQAELDADQLFLDYHASAFIEALDGVRDAVIDRTEMLSTDLHALAAFERVVFDDVVSAELPGKIITDRLLLLLRRALRRRLPGKNAERRRCIDAVLLHQVARESLAALEPGKAFQGRNTGDAECQEGISQAGADGVIGADESEIGLRFLRDFEDRREIHQAHHVLFLADLPETRVPVGADIDEVRLVF